MTEKLKPPVDSERLARWLRRHKSHTLRVSDPPVGFWCITCPTPKGAWFPVRGRRRSNGGNDGR